MSLSYDFLIERAEHSALEAANAVLENARERALRSEAAWRGMAERALKVSRERALADQKKIQLL